MKHEDINSVKAMRRGSLARQPRRPRRGSVYVVVLGAAMIVTVLGFSAVQATRIERRTSAADEAAVKARFYAESAVDVVRYRLANNPTWRSTAVNNAWTSPEIVGEAKLRYKLTDELDADLANDAADPVRLTAMATVGNAVRMFSVELAPLNSGPGANLLINADMESGATPPWFGYPVGNADLESRTDGPHGGTYYVYVKNRNSALAGPAQDISGSLQNGIIYDFDVWVMMDSGSSNVVVQIMTTDTVSGSQAFVSGMTPVGTSWTSVVGGLTPSWSGTLISAELHIHTLLGTTHFRIDDASLRLASTAVMVPTEGSWRREVN